MFAMSTSLPYELFLFKNQIEVSILRHTMDDVIKALQRHNKKDKTKLWTLQTGLNMYYCPLLHGIYNFTCMT